MNKKFLNILLIYIFIMIAANTIHPVTPELIKIRKFPDAMFGIALAMMNLTNFIFSSFWGNICDKKGRKIIMIIGCLGYAISQLGFAYSHSVATLITARLLAGFFTGAFSVPVLAYISDISEIHELKTHFTIYATSTAVAAAIGYYLGGIIGSHNLLYAFYCQIILLIIAVMLLFVLVNERCNNQKLNIKQILQSLNPLHNFLKSKINKVVVMMLTISFFIYFANTMFDNSFSYYLSAQLKMKPIVNGVIKATTGLTTLCLNIFVINKLIRKYNLSNIFKIILITSTIILISIIYSKNKEMFFVMSTLFYIIFMCVIPLQQSLIMEHSDENTRGVASGLINSTRSIAGVVAALVAGNIYGKLPEINLPYANARIVYPIIISIICIIVAICILQNTRRKYD